MGTVVEGRRLMRALRVGARKMVFAGCVSLFVFAGQARGWNAVGDTTPWEDNKISANTMYVSSFVAGSSFTAAKMAIFWAADPAGNVSLAIYADSAGSPGTLLDSTATTAAGAPGDTFGYQIIALSTGAAITSGSTYWLGFIQDSAENYVGFDDGGTSLMLAQPCCGWLNPWSGGAPWGNYLTIYATDSIGAVVDTAATPVRTGRVAGPASALSLNREKTRISFDLPGSAGMREVRLKMYDAYGRLWWNTNVSDGLTAGTNSVTMDRLPSAGMYVVKMTIIDRNGRSAGDFAAKILAR